MILTIKKNITKYTYEIVVINASNRNFNTFINIIFSLIISIGVKIENIIYLWLVMVISQNNNGDINNNRILII